MPIVIATMIRARFAMAELEIDRTPTNPPWQEWGLALDVGEASIGWAVGLLEGDGNLKDFLNAGVRLFEGAWRNDAGTFKACADEDRGVRGQQRRHETRQRRLATLTRLFAVATGVAPHEMKRRAGFLAGQTHRDPVEVFARRARAAREPLSLEDLFQALHHMAAHRGVRLATPDDSEKSPRDTKGKKTGRTRDDADDAATLAKARDAEGWFRNRMSAAPRADGSTPTCGEILHDLVQADRDAHGRRSQPLTRARHGCESGTGVNVPTRALVAEEFDRIRSVQEPHHPTLDWDALRTLVLDQLPISLPPAAPCLFLGELVGKPFRGWIVARSEIDRGLVNDPLMQALRNREAVGNLRLGTEQDGPYGRKIWMPRVLEEQGLLHGELTPGERDVLVDALLRMPQGIRTDSRGYVTCAAMRAALGLGGKERFGIEREGKGGGIKPNPTDPMLARWISGWFGNSLTARSLYYRDLVERRADSRRLREYLAAGGHGIAPVPADRLDATTATLLESDLFDSPLYSVCHRAAEAILAAWAERPAEGFYTVIRDLFGFAPNEIVLNDLERARACLHETLPWLAPRTPGELRAAPLKDCAEVIPSQLITTLLRGHKGRVERDPDTWTRLWSGNAATHRIMSEIRKVANTVVNRYGGRVVDGRPLAPLPTTITVELAREAKHGVTRRQEIHDRNRERASLNRKAEKHLDDFCQTRNMDWTKGGIPRERAVMRLHLAERQVCHCPYCGQTFQHTDIFDPTLTEIDHIIERAVGGDSPDNLVLACKDCNGDKGKRTPYEFAGVEMLGRPALIAIWEDFRKSGRAKKGKGKGAAPAHPQDDKEFMDRIGWRFTADARALSEERGRRQDRMLHDTARATRLARLYLTALVLPEDPGRLGARSTEPETREEVYRALARVRPVNGSVTAMLRRRLLGTEKDRTGARHHAEDACLLLMAGLAVVQAFNTESARKDEGRGKDLPPVEVGQVADEHHLSRLRRRVGRVALPSLDKALGRWVEPGAHYDAATGQERWTPTPKGKRLRNRLRDLVSKAAVEIRPEKAPESGTSGALHNDNPYGRTEIVGADGTVTEVFHKRRKAEFLIALITDKSKTKDEGVVSNPCPGALVEKIVCDEVEHNHDRVFDPQERFRHHWKSTRITALLPKHTAAVLEEMAELRDLDAIPDKARTPEQGERLERLKQAPLSAAITRASEAACIRAREAEILRRILLDGHWGPRGLRGLSMADKVNPVLIRTSKRDALGRPDPGARAWVKTDGNAVTQIWRVTSVVTALEQRVTLPKGGVTVVVHISNLELARLNARDGSAGPPGDNRPPPLRRDIDRLIAVRDEVGEDSYIASVVTRLREAVAKVLAKEAKTLGIQGEWRLDSGCIDGKIIEVAKSDMVRLNGRTLRVTVMTNGGVWGLPVDYSPSAPRDADTAEAFKARYGLPLKLGNGVPLPVKALIAASAGTTE
jgi:5-methylcytosine-specific restriction endonuclease McrA